MKRLERLIITTVTIETIKKLTGCLKEVDEVKMIREDLKYVELTKIIISAAMKVHRTLWPGFPEVIYQRSFEVELRNRNISFIAEQEQPVFYEGVLVGKRRLDLLAENKILVELKAVSEWEKKHFNQVLNYFEAFNVQIGLLLNFGIESLEIKRFINNKFKEKI